MELVLVAFALISGILNGVGSSGGMLFMSAMLLNGFHPVVATTTNKIIALIGSFGALKNYWLHSEKIRNMKGLILFSVLGVFVGAMIALQFDANTLGKIYTLITFFLLMLLLLSNTIKQRISNKTHGTLKKRGLFIGLISGAYNGFFGPGTIIITSLQFKLLSNYSEKSSLSTAIIINTITNAAACVVLGAGILSIFEVNIFLLLVLVLSNVAGQYLGSLFIVKSGAKYIDLISKATLVVLFFILLNEYWIHFY